MTQDDIICMAREAALPPAITNSPAILALCLAAARKSAAAEREECAKVCDDERKIREEAGKKHPEDSDSRGRCFSAARAAMNCSIGIRARSQE